MAAWIFIRRVGLDFPCFPRYINLARSPLMALFIRGKSGLHRKTLPVKMPAGRLVTAGHETVPQKENRLFSADFRQG